MWANRIRRPAAVIHQIIPGGISLHRDVLTEGADQIVQQLNRQAALLDRVAEREEDSRLRIAAVSESFPGGVHDKKVYDRTRMVCPPEVRRSAS